MNTRKESGIEAIPESNLEEYGNYENYQSQQAICQYNNQQQLPFAPPFGRYNHFNMNGSGIGMPLVRSGIGMPLVRSGVGMPLVRSGVGSPLFNSAVYCGSRYASPCRPGPHCIPPQFQRGPGMLSPPRIAMARSGVFMPPPVIPNRVMNCSRPGMPMLRGGMSVRQHIAPALPIQHIAPAVPMAYFEQPAGEVTYTDVPFERKVLEYVPVEHTIQDSYTIENRTSYLPVPTLEPRVDYVNVQSYVPVTSYSTGEQTLIHHPQSPVSQTRKMQGASQFSQPQSSHLFQSQNAQNTQNFNFNNNSGANQGTNSVRMGGVYKNHDVNKVSLRKNKFDSLN